MPRLLLQFTALALLLLAVPLRAQSFEGLGDFPGGVFASNAQGVSDDGAVVAGYSSRDFGGEAFRWTSDGMVGLGTFVSDGPSYAWAVSGDGSTVVGSAKWSVGDVAFRWTAGGGMQRVNLGILQAGKALGVSASGAVVVGGGTGSGTRLAFRWTESGAEQLPSLSQGAWTEARAVSADGNVVAGTSGGEIALWQNGSLTALGPGSAHGVSADGTIVVGSTSVEGQPHAFIWTAAAGLVPLAGFPGGLNVHAYDVSDAGELVVGIAGATGAPQLAAVWTPDGRAHLVKDVLEDQGLDLTGWTLVNANGVSADGRVIVGSGYNPDGRFEGWRAEILPITTKEIVVTTTGDEPNDPVSQTSNFCDVDRDEPGDQCTLRAAIELANARLGGTITFDIDGDGAPTIRVTEYEDGPSTMIGLPTIEAPVTLDGTTQPGGWVEISGTGELASPGFSGVQADGIRIGADGAGSTMRGLVINRFYGSGIHLLPGSDGCIIEGNRIGTDVAGTARMGMPAPFYLLSQSADDRDATYPWDIGGSAEAGVRIESDNNIVQDNVVAGNAQTDEGSDTRRPWFEGGIDIYLGPSTRNNTVRSNSIGLGPGGEVVVDIPSLIAQGYDRIDNFSTYEYVGILARGSGHRFARNLIGGHSIDVLVLSTAGNRLADNTIGHIPEAQSPRGHTALLLVGPGSSLADPDGLAGQGVVERNDVRSTEVAASTQGGWVLTGNDFHGWIGGDTEPPSVAGNSLFYHEAAVVIGDDDHLVSNNIRAAGVAVRVEGQRARVELNDIREAWAGIRVPDAPDIPNDPGPAEPATVLISRNSIVSRHIGIDLGGSYGASAGVEVTLNDVSDLDQGPNGLLNFPVPLMVARSGSLVHVEGILWGAFSGTTTVEVFANTKCAAATSFGVPYGAGEHYLGAVDVTPGVGDLGESAFEYIEGGFEPGYEYVTLTSTRADLGVTSEFSRCVRAVDLDQTARADVEADQTGEVLNAQDAAVSIEGTAAGKGGAFRDGGSRSEAGTLYLTRYEAAHDSDLFADTSATAADGSDVRPTALASAYWWLTDRGLTAAGGADEATLTLRVCIRPGGRVLDGVDERVVLVQRNAATEGAWTPLNTEAENRGGETYLCAGSVTELGEFGLGGAEEAFPVARASRPEEGPLSEFALTVYPNPAQGPVTLVLAVPTTGEVRVEVFDLLGRRAVVLHDGPLAAGPHTLRFDAIGLPSGVYFARAAASNGAAASRGFVVAQ